MSSADVFCVVGGDWAVLHMLLAGCVVWVLPVGSFVGSVIDVIVFSRYGFKPITKLLQSTTFVVRLFFVVAPS